MNQPNFMQNIVSTAFLGAPVDLNLIAQNAINIEYNKSKFTAAILRIRSPKTTILLFGSGKIVCTGAKSIVDNKKGGRRAARIVQKIYKRHKSQTKIKFLDYKVQNIVASFSVPYKIDLLALNIEKYKNSFYDPTIFPGLKFNPFKSEKTTVLIFISGKVVITGLKDYDKVVETRDYMTRLLLKFKRSFPYLTENW
jgi:transcription initiation factor TFIID TATA-box-binding protein